MGIDDNPLLTEAKYERENNYVPFLFAMSGHMIGAYIAIHNKYPIWAMLGIGVGCGYIGLTIGKGVTKLIIHK